MAIDVDDIKRRANDLVDQAADAAGELAEQAKPHLEQAREAADELAEKTRPHAERAIEWAAGVLDRAFDLLEEGTRTDLDGDGVVGAARGDAPAPGPAAEGAPAGEAQEASGEAAPNETREADVGSDGPDHG